VPGKHAPESPNSFYLSVARAVLGALAVLGVVIAIVLVLVNRGGDEPDFNALPSSSPTQTTTRSSPTPTASESKISPVQTLRPKAKVTIAVLNGTGRAGLAAKVQDKLEKAGYNVITIGNASRTIKTTVFFRKGAKADAQALLDAYDEFGRVAAAGDESDDKALITIILGSDYPS
jgi:hypothetical protein